jgi:transcription antitermination factor NusG
MNRLAILQVPGVVRIVGINSPEPIPDEEIEAILKLSASERHLESLDYFDPYVEGAWVDVIQGPLAGIRGQLVRKEKHHCLVIRAHLIQRAAIVHVDMSEVMPISSGTTPIPIPGGAASSRCSASSVNAK